MKSSLHNICTRLVEAFRSATICSKPQSLTQTIFQPNGIASVCWLSNRTVNPFQQNRYGSTWRYASELNMHYGGAYPNKIPHYTHHKHYKSVKSHTYGVQKQTRLRPICNAKLGREAMAEGRPPRVIQVYSNVHSKKPHGAYGKLGDRVLMAIKGEMKKGIIVGLRKSQLHGIPRFDTNNVVLIEDSGSPTGNRVNAPIPNCIRPILKRSSHPKKADYTKLFSIATKFV